MQTHTFTGMVQRQDWHTSPGCGSLDLLQICNGTFRPVEKAVWGVQTLEYLRKDMALKVVTKTLDRLHYTLLNTRRCRDLNIQHHRGRGRAHSETSLKREAADKERVCQ